MSEIQRQSIHIGNICAVVMAAYCRGGWTNLPCSWLTLSVHLFLPPQSMEELLVSSESLVRP